MAEAAPTPLDMAQAECCEHAGRHHRDRKTDAEADDQREAEAELLELQAEQQHGDRGRAGDQAAGETEQHDLPGGDIAAGKALADVGGMRAGMGIALVAEIHVRMRMIGFVVMAMIMIVVMMTLMIMAAVVIVRMMVMVVI